MYELRTVEPPIVRCQQCRHGRDSHRDACIGARRCPCPGFTPWRTTAIERTVTHG